MIEVLCGQDKENKVLAMPHANTGKQRKEEKKLIEFKWSLGCVYGYYLTLFFSSFLIWNSLSSANRAYLSFLMLYT